MSSPSSLHESSPLPVSIYLSLSLLSLSRMCTHTPLIHRMETRAAQRHGWYVFNLLHLTRNIYQKFTTPLRSLLNFFPISATWPPDFLHLIIPLASLSCVASHLYPSAVRGISCTNGKPKAASKMWDGHQHLDPLMKGSHVRPMLVT